MPGEHSAINRVTKISDALVRHTSAGTGMVLTSGGKLNAPLGVTIAPNGDVLTVRCAAALRPRA